MIKEYMYKLMLKKFAQVIGPSSCSILDYAVAIAENDTVPRMRRRATKEEKAAGISMLADDFAAGLVSIIEACGLKKDTPKFCWAADNYGKTFGLGVETPASGFAYSSRSVRGKFIDLEMTPLTIRQDIFLKVYEGTLRTGHVPTPVLFVPRFSEFYSPADQKTYRKLTLELKL